MNPRVAIISDLNSIALGLCEKFLARGFGVFVYTSASEKKEWKARFDQRVEIHELGSVFINNVNYILVVDGLANYDKRRKISETAKKAQLITDYILTQRQAKIR